MEEGIGRQNLRGGSMRRTWSDMTGIEDGLGEGGQELRNMGRSWKGQRDRFYLRASRKEFKPGQHIDFSPVRPVSNS